MIFSLSLVFVAVLLTGISQVLLKIGAVHHGDQKDSVLAAYLNLSVMTAYALLVFVTVITVIALREVSLKMVYAIMSLNFVVVTVLSHGILKERIGKRMIFALALIISGVLVFNYPL